MSTPASETSRIPEGLRALRHRDFRLFFTGQAVSLVGTWMQSVGQGWLMHRLTGSPLMLGVLSFAQFAPVLPLALWAGVIADRTDRRRMLLWTQSLLLFQAAILATVASTGVVRPWMLISLAVLYGIANTFDLPARQSYIVELTGKGDLPNGIALNSAAFNSARIVGPAIAGVLVGSVGEAGCFWINVVSFGAVIAGLLAIRTRRVATPEASDERSTSLKEGLAYVWSAPSIRRLLVLLGVCAGLGFQYNTLLPVYARDILHSGPEAYGLLFSAFGAGSLLAALRMTAAHERWALRRHLLFGLIAAGLGLGGFAWVRWLPAMAAFAALAGFGLILYISSTNTLIQLTVEDRFRGRVMSLYTLSFVGTSPFGSLIAGAVAQRFGAPVATSLCAVILLGGAIWVSGRLRAIAAREAAEREAAERPPAPEPEAAG